MGYLTDIVAFGIQAIAPLLTRPAGEVRKEFSLPCNVSAHRATTDAGLISFKLYCPATPPGPLPVFLNIHGGGYVMGCPDQDDHICRYLANRACCAVVNINYDTAPQARYPTAPEQCFSLARWLSLNGDQLDLDAARLAVGGHSAGGALAAGLALRAAQDEAFQILGLIVDYAILDLAADPRTKHRRLPRPLITPLLSRIFTDSYIPDRSQRLAPLASPLLATNMTLLPPTLVITAEFDTLRDEGDAFADRLRDAGVLFEHVIVPGVDHFFTHTGPVPQARLALDTMVRLLDHAFRA